PGEDRAQSCRRAGRDRPLRRQARRSIRHLARQHPGNRELPQHLCQAGGLGMKMIGFDFFEKPEPPSSQDLEKAWRPYIETCIAAFGPQRSMFESNFPVDKGTCSYQVLWNAFKRIAAGHSTDEKTALFSRAAKKACRLDVSCVERQPVEPAAPRSCRCASVSPRKGRLAMDNVTAPFVVRRMVGAQIGGTKLRPDLPDAV